MFRSHEDYCVDMFGGLPLLLSIRMSRAQNSDVSGVDVQGPGSEIGNGGSPNSQQPSYQVPVTPPLSPPNSFSMLPPPECEVEREPSPKPAEATNSPIEEPFQQLQLDDPLPGPSTSFDEEVPVPSTSYSEKIRQPQINSHGKVKIHKCKAQGCQYETPIKAEFWTHQRQHMKPEKIIECHLCPFATNLNHHMDFHKKHHMKIKPFKCEKCSYSCINKSMLTSHLKSHSSVYQYRCRDCQYATKHVHALKKHLKSKNHQHGVILHPDGTINPNPILDVYGTRRGPKVKTVSGRPRSQPEPQPETRPEPEPERLPEATVPAVENPPEPLPQFNFNNLPQAIFLNLVYLNYFQQLNEIEKHYFSEPAVAADAPLDLSLPGPSSGRPRTGPAFRSHFFRPQAMEDSDDSDNDMDVQPIQPVQPKESERLIDEDGKCSCPHCGISFDDAAIYQMHMIIHDLNDPFTCRLCGTKCGDKHSFNSHFFHTRH